MGLIEAIKGAGKTVKNYASAYNSDNVARAMKSALRHKKAKKVKEQTKAANKDTKRMKAELLKKMMDKYPSSTLIGDRKFAKRKKEVSDMIDNGNMKGARDFVLKKAKEFNKLNY